MNNKFGNEKETKKVLKRLLDRILHKNTLD